jgi:uncharacterized membrane protein YhaH (DUF805 family)
MQDLIHQFRQILDMVLMHPSSSFQFWITLGAAVFVCILVVKGVSASMQAEHHMFTVCMFTAVIGMFLMLAVMAIVKARVIPVLPSAYRRWAVPASALVAALLFAVPLLGGMHGMNYLSSFITWLIALAAAAAVVYALNTGFGSARSGSKSTGQIRSHKSALQEVMQ